MICVLYERQVEIFLRNYTFISRIWLFIPIRLIVRWGGEHVKAANYPPVI